MGLFKDLGVSFFCGDFMIRESESEKLQITSFCRGLAFKN
jgi:hypothetical protein